VKAITAKKGMTTLTVLRDINIAARYADEIVVLKAGEIYSSGSPSKVITEEMLYDVYGVDASVKTSAYGLPEVSPIGSLRSLPWFKKNQLLIR
jgi:iron complex transport system ATP-binding protein